MKIFFSWSGNKSHEIAKILSEWIPCVVQAAEKWISSKDIDRGAMWFGEIAEQLKDSNFGIVVLTKENQNKPWLMFESGALYKGLLESRICTFLVDLSVRDIDTESPIRQVNHTVIEKESIFSLIKTINKCVENGSIPEENLKRLFDAMWPTLEEQINIILESEPVSSGNERKDTDVLNDILENILVVNKKTDLIMRERRFFPKSAYRDPGVVREKVGRLLKLGADQDDIMSILDGDAPKGFIERTIVRLSDSDDDI